MIYYFTILKIKNYFKKIKIIKIFEKWDQENQEE